MEKYTRASAQTAAEVYTSAKVNLLPHFAKVRVAKAEELAGVYVGPTYKKLVATSYDFLFFTDDKVVARGIHGRNDCGGGSGLDDRIPRNSLPWFFAACNRLSEVA